MTPLEVEMAEALTRLVEKRTPESINYACQMINRFHYLNSLQKLNLKEITINATTKTSNQTSSIDRFGPNPQGDWSVDNDPFIP